MPRVRLGVECRARTWQVLTDAPDAIVPSTLTRPSAASSSNSPEPMRATAPTGCEPRWRSRNRAFRTEWLYDIAYDATPFIRESAREGFQNSTVHALLEGV
jgi:hypothetical protein